MQSWDAKWWNSTEKYFSLLFRIKWSIGFTIFFPPCQICFRSEFLIEGSLYLLIRSLGASYHGDCLWLGQTILTWKPPCTNLMVMFDLPTPPPPEIIDADPMFSSLQISHPSKLTWSVLSPQWLQPFQLPDSFFAMKFRTLSNVQCLSSLMSVWHVLPMIT